MTSTSQTPKCISTEATLPDKKGTLLTTIFSTSRPSAESLVGTFFGDLEEPTIMLLKTTDGADRGAEQLVHQDDEHKCGILFAVRKQIFANQWYDSCELRVNSAHSPPIMAQECIESFIRICDPEHIVAQTVWPTFCVYIVSSPTGVKSAVRSKYIRQLYKTAKT
ncbi:uncharacterized protein LOC119165805 isoform X3 [Rhipicephalus microplus]|uniref:uncharacterized protein LOC119165805 isoform X3 n=1 Tax=Rhipicephalus microplus TaxID=6941 RepID=UPI003F6C6A84